MNNNTLTEFDTITKPKTGWTYKVEVRLDTGAWATYAMNYGISREAAREVKSSLKTLGTYGQNVRIVREQDGTVVR